MIDLNLNNVVEIKPQTKSVGDAIDDFRRMATEHGLSISDVKISDNIERVSLTGKPNKLDGWYALHVEDDILYGAFGNWVTHTQKKFSSRSEFLIDSSVLKRMEMRQAEYREAAKRKKEDGALEAQNLVATAHAADPSHEYLQKKGIAPHGALQTGAVLQIPISDLKGKIISTQRIAADGSKLFQKGADPVGVFVIGGASKVTVMCEGFATGASIHEATGHQVYVCFSSHSMVKLAPAIEKVVDGVLMIGGDNDEAGRRAAESAKKACTGASIVYSDVEGQDFNDVFLSNPEKVRELFNIDNVELPPFDAWVETDFSTLTYPEFVYSDFYARGYTSVTLAAPKAGKSLLALCEAIDMATGLGLLTGRERQAQRVLYFNAEDDDQILKSRVAGICKHYNIDQKLLVGKLWLTSGVEWNKFHFVEGDEGSIREDVFVGIERFIQKNNIDCAIFDPLQDMSDAPETNDVFRRLGRRLRKLASENDCSIGLIHHLRKVQAGIAVSIDDGRGGSALRGSARFNRVLVGMDENTGTNAGVEDYRNYVRIGDAESNLAPPSSDKNRWFEKKSVRIDAGFHVGVIAPWKFPDAFDGIELSQVAEFQRFIRQVETPLKADVRANGWVGEAIAERFDLDLEKKADKSRVKRLLAGWVETDVLRIEKHKEARTGREIRVVVSGENNVRS